MRCPKCGLELNPLSERCPNCGTSAKLAKPDGDTMTRVRRQIAVVRRKVEEPDEDYSDASFSPVMKFQTAAEKEQEKETALMGENPAENFEDNEENIFTPVDLAALMRKKEETEADIKHRSISAEIRRMVRHKEDDLLAEYYFKDGISDLEKYQLAQSFADMEKAEAKGEENGAEPPSGPPSESSGKMENGEEAEPEEQMSEAARRLNTFPEESGLDKVLTFLGEKYDGAVLAVKGFFHQLIHVRIKRVYDKLDKKTAPFLDKVLDKLDYIRAGKLKHGRDESAEEKRRARRVIWSICGVLAMVLLCVGIFVASLFTDGITGQWIVSYDVGGKPNVIMEFKPGGSAVVSVKSDDGWHVHKQGQYKTQRKNGHDMLTITYEDGTISRLYYEIDGKSGTFINVETNVEVVYDLK